MVYPIIRTNEAMHGSHQRRLAIEFMTKWKASTGEIFEFSADVLICSANPQLNLAGGVGGEFLRRYGSAMQGFLHNWLRDRGQRFVSPGTVVVAPPCGSSFRAIIH